MKGLKLLFLAIWDEFKTLIFIPLRNQNKGTIRANHNSKEQERNTHFVVTRSGDKRTKDERDKCEKIEGWRFILEILTFVTVLIGAIIYFRQMQANLRQAKTAEAQLNEMRGQRIIEERAWVFPTEVDEKFSDSGELYFWLHYKNTGKSPAIKFGHFADIYTDINAIPKKDPESLDYRYFVGPDASGIIPTDAFKIPEYAVRAIKGHAVIYYLAGTISYDDIFGRHHWNQFCYKVMPNLMLEPISTHSDCDDTEATQKQ